MRSVRVAGRRVLAADRRLRNRRGARDRRRTCRASSPQSLRIVAKRRRVLIAGEKTPRRATRRSELSSRRARLRALRARRAPASRVRCRASAARDARAHGELRDHAAEDRRAPRRAGSRSQSRSAASGHDAHPLHRRHRRPARPRARATRAARRSSSITSVDLVIANAENAAAGFGITREIGDQLLDWGVDVMTSGNHIWDKKEALDYIGAEPRLLRPANYPAGVRRATAAISRGRATARSVGVDQRHGPRVHAATSTIRSPSCCSEIEALRAAHAHHLRGLPRRSDVGEDRDGLAPRRQGDRRRRHAHARADRRRAHPAEGHGVSDRRRA